MAIRSAVVGRVPQAAGPYRALEHGTRPTDSPQHRARRTWSMSKAGLARWPDLRTVQSIWRAFPRPGPRDRAGAPREMGAGHRPTKRILQ